LASAFLNDGDADVALRMNADYTDYFLKISDNQRNSRFEKTSVDAMVFVVSCFVVLGWGDTRRTNGMIN
jgi:hypothetical protein